MAMFLRNAWYVAAWGGQVLTDAPTRIQVMNEWIAIFRAESGVAHAIADRCPHRFASLGRGRVVGENLQCPYHGLQFDGAGRCVRNPHGDGMIPPGSGVTSYPLVERHGALWIWMGDREKADPALIPDFSILEDPKFATTFNYLRVRAGYDLVTDNLLDLSHVPFLHPRIVSRESVARTTVETEQQGLTVWHKLTVRDEPVSPLFDLFWEDDVRRGTIHVDMRWDAPSHLFLDSSVVPDGKGREQQTTLLNAHLLTPETDATTHYFWTSGRNRRQDDTAVSARIDELIGQAFQMEDEPMIEEVQRNMGGEGFWALRPIILSGDGAAVRARRILNKLINAEKGVDAEQTAVLTQA